jgi:hypothetical protein
MHVDLALRAGRGEVDLAEPVDELVVEPREVRRLSASSSRCRRRA